MSENQPTTFYAVAYGNKRGVFTNYKEAQAAMKGFPSPVYKKFPDQAQAEEFQKKHQPESTSFEANENDTGNFYAVARGRVIGIFKDFETVKKNIAGFPKPMHKKFTNFAEAKSYFDKYAEGKAEERSPKKKAAKAETKEENSAEADKGVKPVARKRTSGKVGETDESDGDAGQLDQSMDGSDKKADESIQSGEGDSAADTSLAEEEEEKPATSNGEQKEEKEEGQEKKNKPDADLDKNEVKEAVTDKEEAAEYEPSQKHAKMEE